MGYKVTVTLLTLMCISGCGGDSDSSTFSAAAITVFNDGAGVGRVENPNGAEFVYIAPNIVADVNATNGSQSSSTAVDVTQYPIISQSNGYNLRQGTLSSGSTTVNVIIAERINSGKASIAYLYDNSSDAIAAGGGEFSGAPSGTHSYSGIYISGGRYSNFAEIGSLSLTANFDNSTFSINGSSASSSLNGSGFIDASTGRISSGNLTFTSPSSTTYGASTFGNLTGSGASDVSGVIYTNDTNPDYSGLTLAQSKIFTRLFSSFLWLVLIILGNQAQACTRNLVDEVLSLKCHLRFIAGKVVHADTVENLNVNLRRNGYPALQRVYQSSYYDTGYTISPVIKYDPNLNGGNPAKNLRVGNLEFVSDPNRFKKDGLALGFSFSANGRYASTNNIIADVNAHYTYEKSIDFSHFEIRQSNFLGCIKKHIASWNIGSFCVNKEEERRFLSQSENKIFSFAQQIYKEFKADTFMFGYKITSETNGYEFNRAILNVQSIDFLGKGFDLEIGTGQSRTRHSVRDYSAHLRFSGNHSHLRSVKLTFNMADLPPLLGVKREDKKSKVEAALALSQKVTLEVGYEILDSSIDYFDTEYPFIKIQLSH